MRGYLRQLYEFAKVRMEQTSNNTQIARDIKNKFGIDNELDRIRRFVSRYRERLKIQAKAAPIKRLFFDIETGYHLVRMWRIGKVGYVSPEQIKEHKQIFCICYKWQGDDTVHCLRLS